MTKFESARSIALRAVRENEVGAATRVRHIVGWSCQCQTCPPLGQRVAPIILMNPVLRVCDKTVEEKGRMRVPVITENQVQRADSTRRKPHFTSSVPAAPPPTPTPTPTPSSLALTLSLFSPQTRHLGRWWWWWWRWWRWWCCYC
jgi:hypothetical protein